MAALAVRFARSIGYRYRYPSWLTAVCNMTGIVGGTVSGPTLDELAGELHEESWYGRERFAVGDCSLALVHHGERDTAGRLTWTDGERAGVVHGAISNRDELNLSTDELFEALFADPTRLCARLDGPFVVAGVDGTGRVILGTDRLGTRPCYYHAGDGIRFASSLTSLLAGIDNPTVDERAVADMLLMGTVWGEKTLLSGVTKLPPATVLEYDGTLSTERYWSPSFDALPADDYLPGLVERYRTVIGDMATTMDGDAGLWLSGGLDSRTMAAELASHAGREFGELETYTYDANPSGGGNPKLAGQVAAHLDLDIDLVELTPELFIERLGEAVDLTDGMLRWPAFLNLLSVYTLPDPHAGVLLEGAGQGELMGHHLRRHHFTGTDSAIESLYWSEAMLDRESAAALLDAEVDPLQSLIDTADGSERATKKGTILEAHFDNYYSRVTLASNTIPRSQAGTRVPFAHQDFLEYAARLPLKYRIRTIPLTGGKIPYGMTPAKLALTETLDADLADIRYERTGVAPKHPYPVHVAGFLTTTALTRLAGGTSYGGRSVPDEWYRNHSDVREFIDGLLEGACDRPFFDGEEIRRLRREHLTGEANHMVTSLAAITTLELWLQRNLD
jgi:asparagine synthase (glutamine-hydrolysing)